MGKASILSALLHLGVIAALVLGLPVLHDPMVEFRSVPVELVMLPEENTDAPVPEPEPEPAPINQAPEQAPEPQPEIAEAPTPEPALVPEPAPRSEEHTSELQSLMRISYAVFCLKKKTHTTRITQEN